MTAIASSLAGTLRRGTSRNRVAIVLDGVYAAALLLGTFLGVLALGLLLWTVYDQGWDRLAGDPLEHALGAEARSEGAGPDQHLGGLVQLVGEAEVPQPAEERDRADVRCRQVIAPDDVAASLLDHLERRLDREPMDLRRSEQPLRPYRRRRQLR